MTNNRSDAAEPTDGRDWFQPSVGSAVTEPTRVLPLVTPPPVRTPPPLVVARAVIVYQDRPRRPWRLWMFSVAIVALTVGVVLGQTAAFEPVHRPAGARVAALPAAAAPSPSTVGRPWPDAEHRVTAPLGAVRQHRLEVTGTSAVLRVRAGELGETLTDIATLDRSAVPRLSTDQDRSRLDLTATGEAGTAGAEIQLNTQVAWTLVLAGGSAEQTLDLRAGRTAGLTVTGGTAQLVLRLPEPRGTVPIAVSGPVGELVLRTPAGTAVRLRLRGGTPSATFAGQPPRPVEAGGTLRSPGWSTAENRYDVVAADPVSAVTSAAS